jgi:hypothetical protein
MMIMMKRLLIICLLAAGSTVYGQNASDSDIVEIYRQFHLQETRGCYLRSTLHPSTIEEIEMSLAVDTIWRRVNQPPYERLVLTKKDRRAIRRQLREIRFHLWDIKALTRYGISNFIIPDKEALDSAYRYDRYIYTISRPIFIKNNSICFAYVDHTCGALCGEGDFIIYRREGGIWRRWWTLYTWVS